MHYVLENDREFREYVRNYTNASTIVKPRTSTTPRTSTGCSRAGTRRRARYDSASVEYEGMASPRARRGEREGDGSGEQAHGAHGVEPASGGEPPEIDSEPPAPALRVPDAEAPLRPLHPGGGGAGLRRPREDFLEVAEALCENSGPRAHHRVLLRGRLDPAHGRACSTSAPRRSSSCCSGNIGRPGGGILALRGHASIQGSTDIPTLYNILPGYIPMPHSAARARTLEPLRRRQRSADGGFWGNIARLHGVAC